MSHSDRRRASGRVFLVAALLCFGASSGVAADPAGKVVTYQVVNYGARTDGVAVTFGSIFAPGDVPRATGIEAVDADGGRVPMQLDRKATHPDGSLRHGIVTLVIPHLAQRAQTAITLRRVTAATDQGHQRIVSLADLPSGFDASVVLNAGGHRLTASPRPRLLSGKLETWLRGPYVSEWWVSQSFTDEAGRADPHLAARFGIRCYGKGEPVRLDIVVENDWTHVAHPRTEFYDAEIRLGGKTVFAKAGMVQPSQTRWRKGFWWSEPVSAYVRQDLDYLKKARVVPNFDPTLRLSASALSKMYDRFENSDRDPMGGGLVTEYMPTTGSREDIAPLPEWQAIYLLSMDPRAYRMTLQNADLGASFPSHYRNERTGRPTTFEDYPDISVDSDMFGKPGQLEVPDAGGHRELMIPDSAHEPALDFIPYLITGDLFYLEELQFWSMWNSIDSGPEYRGYGLGLLHSDQVRGQAWSLRTLAQAEYITPDADPLKPVLQRQLKANIAWYEARYSSNPSANKLGAIERLEPFDEGRSIAPSEDDFFTWSVDYVHELGDVNALALLRWKAKFPVGRMVAPGFCWILAPAYTLRVRNSEADDLFATFAQVYQATLPLKLVNPPDQRNLKCASPEMAKALGLSTPGEMINHTEATDGLSACLQPALAAAVDSRIPGADAAWKLFMSRPLRPDYSIEPGWDIIPWSSAP